MHEREPLELRTRARALLPSPARGRASFYGRDRRPLAGRLPTLSPVISSFACSSQRSTSEPPSRVISAHRSRRRLFSRRAHLRACAPSPRRARRQSALRVSRAAFVVVRARSACSSSNAVVCARNKARITFTERRAALTPHGQATCFRLRVGGSRTHKICASARVH